MKMSMTEGDKRLLSYLAAFLIAMAFIVFVFRPLITETTRARRELSSAMVEVKNYQKKMDSIQEMQSEEQEMTELSEKVLSRFYPTMQNQEAEKMVTILMTNHRLQIQNMNVSELEKGNDLEWYPYSENAGETTKNGEQPDEELIENIQLYSVRVTCVADGSIEDMWKLIDDVSENYPAISITGAEWSTTVSEETETDRLTISFEIFMCDQ